MFNRVVTKVKRSHIFFPLTPISVLMVSVLLIDPVSQLQKGIQIAAAFPSSELFSSDFSITGLARNRTSFVKAPEARSEAFWLSRFSQQSEIKAVSWNSPVAVGDHIMLNYGPYNQRRLEVVSVQEEQDTTTKIVTDFSSEPHYVLTCKDAMKEGQTLIKLTVDADGRTVTAIEADYKTL